MRNSRRHSRSVPCPCKHHTTFPETVKPYPPESDIRGLWTVIHLPHSVVSPDWSGADDSGSRENFHRAKRQIDKRVRWDDAQFNSQSRQRSVPARSVIHTAQAELARNRTRWAEEKPLSCYHWQAPRVAVDLSQTSVSSLFLKSLAVMISFLLSSTILG